MHVVTFHYPYDAAKPFNLKHFMDVHLPLGVRLCREHLKLVPIRIAVHVPAPPPGAQPAWGAVSQVYLKNQEEARTFLGLFNVPEAARLLIADFANYTAGPPQVDCFEIVDFNG